MEKRNTTKFLSYVVFFMFAAARYTFGQQLGGLENILNAVLELFSSTAMRLVFTIALGGIGIALVVNRDNQALKQKIIAWGLGLVGVLSAPTIAGFFWDEAQ